MQKFSQLSRNQKLAASGIAALIIAVAGVVGVSTQRTSEPDIPIAGQVLPGSTYVPTLTTTPTPWPQTGFPLIYGVALNNSAASINQANLDILARFDIAELQLEGMLAKTFSGTPIADGTRSPGKYIKDESEVNTDVALYVDIHAPAVWQNVTPTPAGSPQWYYASSMSNPVANVWQTPTATPTSVATATPSCNANDYYCFRRLQAYMVANKHITPTPDCAGWTICTAADKPVSGSYNRAMTNTYNDTGAHTVGADTYVTWLLNTIRGLWDTSAADIIREDDGFIHRWAYLNTDVDQDYDNTNDEAEYGGSGTEAGRRDRDLLGIYGSFDFLNGMRTSGTRAAYANGKWEPAEIDGTTGTWEYIAQTSVDGVMLELQNNATVGPQGYFKQWDGTTGSCTWDCQQKVMYDWGAAGKRVVLTGNGGLLMSWFSSYQELFIYHLASALLQGQFIAWGSDGASWGSPVWKPEYRVVVNPGTGQCESTTASAGHHWMGAPTAAAKRQDDDSLMSAMLTAATWDDTDSYGWYRVYDHAWVAVNPTGASMSFTLPSGTFKKVDSATSYTSSYTLPAHSGVVLCNYTALAATATPTPTPGATATPTHTPTHTPTATRTPTPTATSVDPTGNLLQNGCFETYTGTQGDGTSDTFTNWTKSGVNDGSGEKAEASATAHEGSNAVKFTNGDGSPTLYQDASVVPGRVYRLQFYTRGDGSNSAYYGINNTTDGSFLVSYTDTGVTGTSYTLYSTTFTVPAGMVTAGVYVGGSYQGGATSAYVDCVSLVAVGTPTPTSTPTATQTPTNTPTATPESLFVAINEVGGDATDNNQNGVIEPQFDQCVELVNTSGDDISIEGWEIYNNGSLVATIDDVTIDGDYGLWALFGVAFEDDWQLQPGLLTLVDSGSTINQVTLPAAISNGYGGRRLPDGGAFLSSNPLPTCGWSNTGPTPEPTVSITPTARPTYTATPTATATPTRTPTATRADFDDSTATPTPTDTPLPSGATSTPVWYLASGTINGPAVEEYVESPTAGQSYAGSTIANNNPYTIVFRTTDAGSSTKYVFDFNGSGGRISVGYVPNNGFYEQSWWGATTNSLFAAGDNIYFLVVNSSQVATFYRNNSQVGSTYSNWATGIGTTSGARWGSLYNNASANQWGQDIVCAAVYNVALDSTQRSALYTAMQSCP